MDGAGWVTTRLSSSVKVFQNGKVQFYAFVFVIGTVIIAVWSLFL
jgi:hypothetical protein